MNHLDDAARSFFNVLSENNFRNGPLDHDVESCNHYFDAMSFAVAQEIDPRSGATTSSVFPVHVDEVSPINLVQRILFNESKLLCKDF